MRTAPDAQVVVWFDNNISMRMFAEDFSGRCYPFDDAAAELNVPSTSEMAFLEVLDRRRYRVELVEGQAEQFRATGRTKL